MYGKISWKKILYVFSKKMQFSMENRDSNHSYPLDLSDMTCEKSDGQNVYLKPLLSFLMNSLTKYPVYVDDDPEKKVVGGDLRMNQRKKTMRKSL